MKTLEFLLFYVSQFLCAKCLHLAVEQNLSVQFYMKLNNQCIFHCEKAHYDNEIFSVESLQINRKKKTSTKG